jgi:peptidoglycan-associated lipoprotein
MHFGKIVRFGVGAAAAAAFLGLVACKKDEAPGPKDPSSATTAASATPSATPAASVAAPAKKADVATPSSGSIHVDDKLSKLCGNLPETHFAYDSADVEPTAGKLLDPLAACFLTGPGKGKGLRLVGHADPRGETEHNFALGMKRAGSVSKYLASKGMTSAQLETTSKGELEASGTDEVGWAKDRKVEIYLAE